MRFLIETNHENPPGNQIIFEEYFANRFIEERPGTLLEYIPVCWTNYYVSKNYCNDDMSDIQEYLDGLDRSKQYFTVVQWDDGIVNNIDGLSILKFASGGVGDYAYPLNCMPNYPKITMGRQILCSFVGSIFGRHLVREEMARHMSSLQGCVITERTNFTNFQEVLALSLFALCPRGYGKTSFRICEALEAKVIPVYIYDDPWIPFENKLDFEKYGVLCHVDEIAALYDRLNELAADTEKIQSMVMYGSEVYDEYYCYDGCYKQIIEELI